MPHSVSPAKTSPNEEDTMITEAETDNGETQTSEKTMTAYTEAVNGESQNSNVVDQDMTMADVGVEGEDLPQVKEEIKSEVRLEDLFADLDSDEEFPSSNGPDIKISSSPEAPSSPV